MGAAWDSRTMVLPAVLVGARKQGQLTRAAKRSSIEAFQSPAPSASSWTSVRQATAARARSCTCCRNGSNWSLVSSSEACTAQLNRKGGGAQLNMSPPPN